ncbi:hypothetical protein ACFWUZ_34720 [Streptomyces sp. NPDC058646]|uniref:hypothetical protein n=1 Tax=Streptomyces sp. NPDC058646 TaxID=3346574 RepID=UPI003666ED2A
MATRAVNTAPDRAARLTRDLRHLPGLYQACGHLLGNGSSGPPALRERTSGGSAPGLRFNTAASEARDAIIGTLSSWAGLVAQERDVAPPARTVEGLAAFLLGHVDWLAAHSCAPEVSAELGGLVQRATGVADPEGARRIPVGACLEPSCDGTLSARLHRPPAGPPDGSPDSSPDSSSDSSSDIRCSAVPEHRWPDNEWVRLGLRMRRSGKAGQAAPPTAWLAAQDIARMWHLSSGSVYRYASEHRWRRRRRDGRTVYHEADVLNTLG